MPSLRRLRRSYRRLAVLLLALPVVLFALGLLYQAGMKFLEGEPRTLGESLEWAAETLTTTGYGRDTTWRHPVMQAYVILVQFSGVFLVFLVFPVFVIPFFEERFEGRLPSRLPDLKGQVLIYRYGPAVTSLLDELDAANVPVVIFEEQAEVARWLSERGRRVVVGNLEQYEPDLRNLVGAQGLVLNGTDERNAALALSARYHGYQGQIVALVETPARRPPMLEVGATTVLTPDHVLAAAIASRASIRISPRVSGIRQLGHYLEVAELRVHDKSPLAGRSIEESAIRSRTGATVVAFWVGGELIQADLTRPLPVGTILVVVGAPEGIGRLGELAMPVPRTGPIIVAGFGSVGAHVAHLLRDAGESVRVIHTQAGPGVDVVGDPLTPSVLEQAGAREAQAVVLTLETDAAALFGTTIVRSLVPEALIVTAARLAENVSRIHRAGADFALSVGQVAGQLMAFHLLRQEWVSLEAGIKVISTSAKGLAGRPFATKWIREATGCLVVAVERGDRVIMEFDRHFVLEPDDVVYLSGTTEAIGAYFMQFPETRELPVAYRPRSEGSSSEG